MIQPRPLHSSNAVSPKQTQRVTVWLTVLARNAQSIYKRPKPASVVVAHLILTRWAMAPMITRTSARMIPLWKTLPGACDCGIPGECGCGIPDMEMDGNNFLIAMNSAGKTHRKDGPGAWCLRHSELWFGQWWYSGFKRFCGSHTDNERWHSHVLRGWMRRYA